MWTPPTPLFKTAVCSRSTSSPHFLLPSSAGVRADAPPAAATAGTPSCALQPRSAALPVPEGGSIQMPPCAFSGAQAPFGEALGSSFDPCPRAAAGYCGPLPPCSPPPWNHGLSSDVDFYGHGITREGERQVRLLTHSGWGFCSPAPT